MLLPFRTWAGPCSGRAGRVPSRVRINAAGYESLRAWGRIWHVSPWGQRSLLLRTSQHVRPLLQARWRSSPSRACEQRDITMLTVSDERAFWEGIQPLDLLPSFPSPSPAHLPTPQRDAANLFLAPPVYGRLSACRSMRAIDASALLPFLQVHRPQVRVGQLLLYAHFEHA